MQRDSCSEIQDIPKGLLPFLQEHATGPYPKPVESSPQHHTLFIKIYFYINLTYTPRSSELQDTFLCNATPIFSG
jgi:hypothetical protein